MDEQPELITIENYRDTAEAEIAKGLLSSAGIDAFIVGENAGVLYGNTIDSLQLQVNPSDETDARAVLATVAEPDAAERAEAEHSGVASDDDPSDPL